MAKSSAPKPPPFEQQLEDLEALVQRLEAPDVPLDQALELFEKGMKLSEDCRRRLAEAESRVEVLLQQGGEPAPAPFDPEEDE